MNALEPAVRRRILKLVRAQFRIRYDGDHGAPHWGRVEQNGLRLAALTGADPVVVQLFALLHDSQREDEWEDPEHGSRAAAFVKELAAEGKLALTPHQLELLAEACRDHGEGYTRASDVTVMTCWDADRLDLGRVGIRPRAERLCTDAAKDPALMAWAYQRSVRHAGHSGHLGHAVDENEIVQLEDF